MADELKAPSFEASLTELEAVVKEMESGELPLERALALFEKGTQLSAACRKQLDEAETRVEQLIRRGDRVIAEPLKTDAT
ncbi:MAG TPA: exodeoxyribonuclease VII small subunit [Bryobacteraceae bacterium]|nr:exodeoxyribonuclease VII small subunit [Bryobacteraceae bacterium]